MSTFEKDNSPQDSAKSNLPEENILLVLTMTEVGARSFTYLKNVEKGQREIYFVGKVLKGAVSGRTMLLGQFIFEFEKAPDESIPMNPASSNRIYFPEDKRVALFEEPTEEEKKETKERLLDLAEKNPKHREAIQDIIKRLKI